MAVVPGSRSDRAYRVAISAEPNVWQNRLNTLYAPIPEKPFNQTDWPNPLNLLVAARYVAINATGPQNRLGASTFPFAQDDWPNPGNTRAAGYQAAVLATVWQNPQLTVFFPIPEKPFLQTDWPVPLNRLAQAYWTARSSQPDVWQDPQLTVFFPIPEKPFNQDDWPNPIIARLRQPAIDSTYWQNYLPLTAGPKPFFQSDWPNPLHRLIEARYVAVTAWIWQDRNTTLFAPIPTKPFLQLDWPLPLDRITQARYNAINAAAGVWQNPLLGPIFPTLISEFVPRRIFDEYPPHIMLVDCSQGVALHYTVTLPSIQVMGMRRWWIKRVDNTPARSLTIIPYVDDTIEGAATLLLPDQFDSVELMSDGVHTWYKVASQGL